MSRVRFAVMVSAVLGFVFAWSSAMAQIAGTAHDFSGSGWGSTEICVYCHAPHNTNTTVAGAPLWNHAVTGQTFTLYSSLTSATFNATMPQPAGVSKLCLSCHDGQTAIDSYGTQVGTHKIAALDPANLGTDLSNDHPIGFVYDAALVSADKGLLTRPTTLPFYGSGKDQLECATCHNVHGSGIGKFLRASNAASALCLTCHNK